MTPPSRLCRVPRGYPATCLVAGATVAGVVTAADVGGSANLPAAGDGVKQFTSVNKCASGGVAQVRIIQLN